MIIREYVTVGNGDIHKFLKTHRHDNICVEEIIPAGYRISYDREYTESELHMHVLRTLIDEHKKRCEDAETNSSLAYLTQEKLAAMEYSISAIKTLVDMGVLK